MLQQAKNGLSEYNSLNDPHLQNYFTNKNVTNFLKQAGVVTRKGEIIPDAIYRTNMANEERRRRAREQLTQDLLDKSIQLQRKYESEIQHRLEEISKLELIRKIRLETRATCAKAGFKLRTKRKSKRILQEKDESAITGGKRGGESVEPNSQHDSQRDSPEGDTYTNDSYSYMTNDYKATDYMTSDYKATDYMTETNDYITNEGTTTTNYMSHDSLSHDYITNEYMSTECTPTTDHTCSYLNSTYQESSSPSTYTKDSYCSFCSECNKECMVVMPDDLLPYSGKPCLQDPNTSVRFHDDSVAPLFPTVDCMLCPLEDCEETCCKLPVTLMFVGCCSTSTDEAVEIHIEQQLNCDTVICVYQECHYVKDIFTFISHHECDFPFILYVYLNGLLHLKLNTCCEYKHLPGYRFGGRRGQLVLVDVKGTSSCTLCEESFTKFQEGSTESVLEVKDIKSAEEIVIDVPSSEDAEISVSDNAEICVPGSNAEMVIEVEGKKPKIKAIENGGFEICDSETTSSVTPSSMLSSSTCPEVVVHNGMEVGHKHVCTTYHTDATDTSHSPTSSVSPVHKVPVEKDTSNVSCVCSHSEDDHHHHHHHHHDPCPCLHHDSSFTSGAPPCAHIDGGGNASGSGRESVASNITGGAIDTGENANAGANEGGSYEEDNEVTGESGNEKVDDIAVTQVEEKDFDGDDEDDASAADDNQSVNNISENEQCGQQLSPQMVLYYQNSNENNSLRRTSPQDYISQVLYLDANLLNTKLEQLHQQQLEGLQGVEGPDPRKQLEDESHESRNQRSLLKVDCIQDTGELQDTTEAVPDDVEVEDCNTVHTNCSSSSSSSRSSYNNNDDDSIISNDDNKTTNNHINNNNNDHNNNNTGSTPLDLVHKSIQVMLLEKQCGASKAETGACTSERGTQVTAQDVQGQELGTSRDFRKSKNEEDTVSIITKLENSVLWQNNDFVLPESALQKQKTAQS